MTQANHTHVLLIDSHIADASKFKVFLEHNSEEAFRVLHFPRLTEALRLLEEKKTKIDAIILDLFLVDPMTPQETFRLVHQAAGDTPVIVIAEKKAQAMAHEVTAGGAADILTRERFEAYPRRLLDAIDFSIIRGRLLREMREKNAAEVRHHQRILHWMTGGYSVETESDPEPLADADVGSASRTKADHR